MRVVKKNKKFRSIGSASTPVRAQGCVLGGQLDGSEKQMVTQMPVPREQRQIQRRQLVGSELTHRIYL